MCTKKEKHLEAKNLKWENILRFRCLEIILLWEGKLTTKHLQSTFGIKRQQASRDFQAYRNIAPDNMVYDPGIKGYKVTNSFTPLFSKGTVEEYFHLVEANGFFEEIMAKSELPPSFTHLLKVPQRNVDPLIIRKVIDACRRGQRIEVNYGSMSTPEGEERIIAPHSIVSSGYRWHTRAYCEKNREYRDFMLGRIFDVTDELGPAINHPEEDQDWHIYMTLELIPNPLLTPDQQKLIAIERGFINNIQTITTRRATANYLLQYMQIPREAPQNSRANPVVLKNPEIMKGLGFG